MKEVDVFLWLLENFYNTTLLQQQNNLVPHNQNYHDDPEEGLEALK